MKRGAWIGATGFPVLMLVLLALGPSSHPEATRLQHALAYVWQGVNLPLLWLGKVILRGEASMVGLESLAPAWWASVGAMLGAASQRLAFTRSGHRANKS